MTRPSLIAGWLLFVVVDLTACHPDPLGRTCTNDELCGSGYGCLSGTCVQLCTSDSECRRGQSCVRYRCVATTQPTPRAPSAAPPVGLTPTVRLGPPEGPQQMAPATPTTPAVPDNAVIELRAIRRELDLIRQDQQKILEKLEKKK